MHKQQFMTSGSTHQKPGVANNKESFSNPGRANHGNPLPIGAWQYAAAYSG